MESFRNNATAGSQELNLWSGMVIRVKRRLRILISLLLITLTTTMMMIHRRSLLNYLQLLAVGYRYASSSSSSSVVSSSSSSIGRRLHLKQVLIIHRHGDRTPITPMNDVEFWQSTLPDSSVLEGIARGTSLLRTRGHVPNNIHGAAGKGPFGQLTMLGLLQMVKLGERLRGELVGFDEEYNLFTPEDLHPRRMKVKSTDFPRTIQSVQAMLTGLFDNDHHDNKQEQMMIEIDLRDTNTYLIPDPQPRQHSLQLGLEKHLADRSHLREREIGLQDLARRVTDELEGYLGEGADGISFGIGEEKEDTTTNIAATIVVGQQQQRPRRRPPLAWAQMCEILVCLHSRSLLPSTLSKEDVTTVSNHVAWRWFENLGHPILAKAAMSKFANELIDDMRRRVNEDKEVGGIVATAASPDHLHNKVAVPKLCIYSAHDSTLIGLLCVLQLERPTMWPEYGSALKVELLREDNETAADGGDDSKYWVRFSLNGQVLRCKVNKAGDDVGDDESEASMVSFDRLVDMINLDYDDKQLKYSWSNKNELLSQN